MIVIQFVTKYLTKRNNFPPSLCPFNLSEANKLIRFKNQYFIFFFCPAPNTSCSQVEIKPCGVFVELECFPQALERLVAAGTQRAYHSSAQHEVLVEVDAKQAADKLAGRHPPGKKSKDPSEEERGKYRTKCREHLD